MTDREKKELIKCCWPICLFLFFFLICIGLAIIIHPLATILFLVTVFIVEVVWAKKNTPKEKYSTSTRSGHTTNYET